MIHRNTSEGSGYADTVNQPQFTDDNTGAQRGEVSLLRSHSLQATETWFKNTEGSHSPKNLVMRAWGL